MTFYFFLAAISLFSTSQQQRELKQEGLLGLHVGATQEAGSIAPQAPKAGWHYLALLQSQWIEWGRGLPTEGEGQDRAGTLLSCHCGTPRAAGRGVNE